MRSKVPSGGLKPSKDGGDGLAKQGREFLRKHENDMERSKKEGRNRGALHIKMGCV